MEHRMTHMSQISHTTPAHCSSKARACRNHLARTLSACALLGALPAAQAITIDNFRDGNALLEVPTMPVPPSGSLQVDTAASVPGGWRTLSLSPNPGSSALAFIQVDRGVLQAFRLETQSLYLGVGYGQSVPMNLDLSSQSALRLDAFWGGASIPGGWDRNALEVTVYATTSTGAGLNPNGSAAQAVLVGASLVDIPFSSFVTNSATGAPVDWADVDGLLFVVNERNPGANSAGFGLMAISAVPEPAAWWLWGTALVIAAARKARRA
jgi:hypothetical protein